jgi:GT2 family glycosyltransferase
MTTPSCRPHVAVVILTINQCDKTIRCLEALRGSHDSDPAFSITVWDNGSRDGTLEAVRDNFPGVTVLRREANLGVAGGRNAAAKAIVAAEKPDFLLFLDNDMVVEEGFVRALVEPFAGERGTSIGQTQAKLRLSSDPRRLNDGGGCRIQFWLGRTRPVGFGKVDRGQFDAPGRCAACCGGAMMVRTDLFLRLGGFDEVFNPFGPEDLDFSLRLQKLGYEAWYVPEAIAYHDVSHTVGAGYPEDYAEHRSRHWLRLMRRHASAPDWIGFVAIGMPWIALRVLFREGRKRNLGALRGLIRGTLGRK